MAYTMRLDRDEDAENPRVAFDNLFSLAIWHHGRPMLDATGSSDTFLERLAVEAEPDVEAELDNATSPGEYDATLMAALRRHYYIQPVHCYEHGSVAYSIYPFGDPFDSGQCGWIYVARDKIRAAYPSSYPDVDHLMLCELGEYEAWRNGDVWGYVIMSESGNEVESSYGFYGYQAAQEAGRDALQYYASEAQ